MAKMSKIGGLSYAEMLGAILKAAEDRLGLPAPAQKIVEAPNGASARRPVSQSQLQ